jgi:hypothetical protein
MSVTVQLIGRLGNNLFQYALGRLLAEERGLALECEQIPWKAHEFLGTTLDHGFDASLTDFLLHLPNVRFAMAGQTFDGPLKTYEFRSFDEWDGQTVDFGELRRAGKIVLRGFFQRTEYYAPHIDRIRDWYRFVPTGTRHAIAAYAIDHRDVVVNIRRGLDMARVDWVLAPSFYRNALESMSNVGRVYVCGTGIDKTIRAALADYDPVYVDGTPHEHFIFLMRFDRMVMSNSTFCWWAAFLSHARELHAPAPALPGVDLRIPERDFREWTAEMEIFRPFLENGQPVSGRELYLRYGPHDLESAVHQLLLSGALRVNPEYEELSGLAARYGQ